MANKEQAAPNEPQEEETPESSAEESTESPQASAPDADGAREATEDPEGTTESGDQLIQHPDGRFEVRPEVKPQ